MSTNLKVLLIVTSILLFLIICRLISKKKLPIKYSLFWIFASVVIFVVGLIPEFVQIFTGLMGFETTSNMVIGVLIGVLFLLTLLLTIIISNQKKQIVLLTQEISLLKSKIEK